MADDSTAIELSRSELREVAGYTVTCARPASLATTADRRLSGALGRPEEDRSNTSNAGVGTRKAVSDQER
jgi:hypothetical protein